MVSNQVVCAYLVAVIYCCIHNQPKLSLCVLGSSSVRNPEGLTGLRSLGRGLGTGAPPTQSASALPLSVTISGESGFLWGCSKSSSSKPGRSPEPPLPSPDIEEGTHTPSCDGRSGQEHPAIHSLWSRTRHP